MRCIELGRERRVVRPVAALDAPLRPPPTASLRAYIGGAVPRDPPDEPDALLGLARRCDRPRPRLGQKLRIDVGEAAVGIDVRSRKIRLEQRRAEPRRAAIQPGDVGVLGLPHLGARRRVVEIVRVVLARVRRVEHERDRLDRGRMTADSETLHLRPRRRAGRGACREVRHRHPSRSDQLASFR